MTRCPRADIVCSFTTQASCQFAARAHVNGHKEPSEYTFSTTSHPLRRYLVRSVWMVPGCREHTVTPLPDIRLPSSRANIMLASLLRQ